MSVKIKLKRFGKVRQPHYRVIVADSRTKRDGRAIEEIGKYHPKREPSLIDIDSQRVQYWLGVGAQPTDPVLALLKLTGDWQRFKGLPGAEGSLQQEARSGDRAEAYNAALSEAHAEPAGEPTRPTRRRAAKSTAAPAGEPMSAEPPAAEAPVEPAATLPDGETAETVDAEATAAPVEPLAVGAEPSEAPVEPLVDPAAVDLAAGDPAERRPAGSGA